jgi:putative tricarboxylic transport membrane protein
MSPLEGLLHGLSVVVQPENLLAALLGAFIGTLVGILPGLGPTAGIAVLLPITFTMDPVAGLIMIAGIYYGVQYGGSLTAIMMNIPGDAAAVMTTLDGYKMTQAGKAGKAIFIVTIGSFLAGTAATLVVTFMSPYIARFGLHFGPAEFVAICTVALVIIAAAFGRPLDGLLPMLVGVAIATVGLDGVSGTARMTFDTLSLSAGFSVVVLAVGLFGLVDAGLTGEPPAVSGYRGELDQRAVRGQRSVHDDESGSR